MSGHRVPLKLYFGIFGILIVLTALTVGVAFVDLGPLNIFVALAIAGVKGLLVLFFFMHVWFSNNLIKVYAAAGFFWLGIAAVLTLADYMTRTWQYVPVGWS